MWQWCCCAVCDEVMCESDWTELMGWNVWCLYGVRPTWRHQHSFSLSADWTASWGEGHPHWGWICVPKLCQRKLCSFAYFHTATLTLTMTYSHSVILVHYHSHLHLEKILRKAPQRSFQGKYARGAHSDWYSHWLWLTLTLTLIYTKTHTCASAQSGLHD